MNIKPGEITDILKREIKDYDRDIDVAETGTVLAAGDGIARVYGLEKALAGELVEFPGDLQGMVLNLEEDNVGAILLGGRREQRSKKAMRFKRTGRIMEVPVGPGMLVGRRGQLPGRGHRRQAVPVQTNERGTAAMERIAPGIVIDRKSVHEPLQTGHQGHRRHDRPSAAASAS